MSTNNMTLRQEQRLEVFPEENFRQKEYLTKVRAALRIAYNVMVDTRKADLSTGWDAEMGRMQEEMETNLEILSAYLD